MNLPRIGKIAWNLASRAFIKPDFAELPSQINNSDPGSPTNSQSESFAGIVEDSMAVLFRFKAFSSAMLLRFFAAVVTFNAILSSVPRFFEDSAHSLIASFTAFLTAPRTSMPDNSDLFWEVNAGAETSTDTIAVRPSV